MNISAAACVRNMLTSLVAAAAIAAQAAAPTWTIESLGTLAPGEGSSANGLNDRGDIVGYGGVGIPSGFGPGYYHGFLWSNGTMVDAGTPSGRMDAYSFLTTINDRGLAVGASDGFVYTWRDGTWTALGFAGEPADMNKFGVIVGTRYTGTGTRGFIYRDGALLDLPTLGGQSSMATAVNDRGLVVGTSSTAGSGAHAFAYEAGVMRDLGTLGGTSSRATDVNSRGVIVGQSETAAGVPVAFIHDGAGMRPLIDAATNSYPEAINDRGDVVGTLDYNAASFLYQDGTLIRLEDIPAVRAAGWTRLYPVDINNRGWITGSGSRGGVREAFVLKPR